MLKHTAVIGLLMFAAGCSTPASTEEGAPASSALLQSPANAPTRWCLIPDSHPWDGDGEVFAVDIDDQGDIVRTKGRFWGGSLTDLYEPAPTDSSWIIADMTDSGVGMSFQGESFVSSVYLDIVGRPDSAVAPHGTARVFHHGSPTEQISIVAGRICPNFIDPTPLPAGGR